MRNQMVKMCFFLISLCLGNFAFAQPTPDGTFEAKRAFVMAYDSLKRQVYLDIDGETDYLNTYQMISLSTTTQFLVDKKKPADWALLRPGAEIKVVGEYYGKNIQATQLILLKDPTDDNDAEGILESAQGKRAVIGGQTVELSAEVSIEGKGEWKNRTYKTFDIIPLGAVMKVKGKRQINGVLIIEKASAEPNQFDNADLEVRKNLTKSLNLNGFNEGKVKISNKEFQISKNTKIQEYVSQIGKSLIPTYINQLEEGHPNKLNFRFIVIEDPTFNAFAYPDGTIFVHTGLLKVLENEAQLAAVLGHEMAHATYEHSTKQLKAQKLLGFASKTAEKVLENKEVIKKGGPLAKFRTVINGNKNTPTNKTDDKNIKIGLETGVQVNVLGAIEDMVMNKAFSLQHEKEADIVGLSYMVRAGYDPREAPKVWAKLMQLNPTSTNLLDKIDNLEEKIYTSHPQMKIRQRVLNQEIAKNYHQTDFSKAKIGKEEYQAIMKF